MRGRNHHLLCEREEELARAREVVAEAAGGHGRLLVVEGAPGIGKTRLLEANAEHAGRAGLEVQWACGDELESGFAYGVLRDLLAPGLARLDPAVRAVVLEGPASAVATVVEGGGRSQTGLEEDALGIAYGLYRLVEESAARRPQLLCVDDAHWADIPSLEALWYLARRLTRLPVVLALGCRLPAEGSVADRLGRLRTGPGARRLAPRPLSEAAVAQLAAAVLTDDRGRDVTRRVLHATGGNPLLVHELLAALAAGESGWEDPDSADVERLVPDSVAQAVRRRIVAAGEAASRLADAVAVFGEATLHDAATLAAVEEPQAVAAADRLAVADILASGPRLRFVHPILRQAVRNRIAPAERAFAHCRAARLLADRGAPLEHVAAHLLEALPRADPWVVETLLAAAAQQQQRGSPETAAALLARARDEPPPPPLRQPVTLALARAQTRTGHPEAVATAREALATAHGPAEEADAALHLVRTLGLAGDVWSALDLLHERTQDASDIDPDLALQLEVELLGIARLQTETRAEALARLDRLAPVALPPRPASRVLLANLALSALERNEPPEQVAELARMALNGGWPVDEASIQLVYAFEALIWTDHLDEAARAADTAVAAAQEGGALTLAALAHGWRAKLNLRRGAVADAAADAEISHNLVTGASPSWGTPFARSHLADVLLVRGEVAEAERVLANPEPVEQAEDNPFYLDSRGRLHLAEDHPEAALADFQTCGGVLARRGGVDAPAVFAWRSQAALALLQLGDRRRAHELAVEEVALARTGQVADAGIRCLHDALDTLQGSPMVLTRVHALTELGAMLRRNRQPRAAREHLKTALDLAHLHRATALADRARDELIIAGGWPRRAAVTGLDALTPSERRVAQLFAQGLTNRHIAHALFVSPRTVTTHLTHIYQKLEISSRAELSALLADHA